MADRRYTLGCDFGGGACKTTLLRDDGEVAATSSSEYPTYYPERGRVEQKPSDWYRAVARNVNDTMRKAGIAPRQVAALCLDAPTHVAVPLGRDGAPLGDAIYWTDTRSVAECRELRERAGALIRERTLNAVDTVWTLPQLLWLKRNRPGVMQKTAHILFAKDYVRYLLTGVLCTDHIEAQGSMLYDCAEMRWSAELCGLIGLDPSLLPPLRSPMDPAGALLRDGARDLGLPEGTPVICGATDTVMEIFAAGSVRPGDTTVKLATAGRICVLSDKPVASPHVINYTFLKDGLWYPGTATKSCASSLRWYRDTFGGTYAALDEAASSVRPGADGLMFHPYLNGELTPYADPLLEASFTGVRSGHTKAHFDRAVLEGVGFSLLACRKVLGSLGIGDTQSARVIGGGAKSPLWRAIVADMLGITLLEPENCDSSLGSAMLAGVAAGFFESLDAAAARCVRIRSVTPPNPEQHEMYAALYARYAEIHDALAPVYHKNR